MVDFKNRHKTPSSFIKSKADFSQAYESQSPLELMKIYDDLDYKVPYHVEHFISGILENLCVTHRIQRPVVADIGCAHGYNGLMLKHRLTYDEIRARARRCDGDDTALVEALTCSDHANTRATFVGSDVAEAAIAFCRKINVHDLSICTNLELEDAPDDARAILASTNLVLSSGVYGYISELTMERIHRYIDTPQQTWFCNFALRPLDYGPTSRMLARRGYRTVRAPVAFPHRQFETPAERDQTLQYLRDAGLDTQPETTTGYLHTYLYLSIPEAATPADPFEDFWAREIPRHTASRLFTTQ